MFYLNPFQPPVGTRKSVLLLLNFDSNLMIQLKALGDNEIVLYSRLPHTNHPHVRIKSFVPKIKALENHVKSICCSGSRKSSMFGKLIWAIFMASGVSNQQLFLHYLHKMMTFLRSFKQLPWTDGRNKNLYCSTCHMLVKTVENLQNHANFEINCQK